MSSSYESPHLQSDIQGREVVPLFPLPRIFLFPRAILPLHVFEPRYRQMVDDLLDRRGRLVLGTVPEEHRDELAGAPPVHPIAGLGEISRHKKLPDGRYLVWLVGLCRVRLREVPSDRLYRKVAIDLLEDVPPTAAQREDLRPRLNEALRSRLPRPLEFDDSVPVGLLTDLLLQCIPMPPDTLQRLYAELDVRRRAEWALVEHIHRPHLPFQDSAEQGDGG